MKMKEKLEKAQKKIEEFETTIYRNKRMICEELNYILEECTSDFRIEHPNDEAISTAMQKITRKIISLKNNLDTKEKIAFIKEKNVRKNEEYLKNLLEIAITGERPEITYLDKE